MQIEQRPIDGLIPYINNSRTHSDEQIAQIAASIKEFGWTNPILVDGDNGIIAGHGRLLAARKLGLTEVPVIELAHMTDHQKRAYIITDNKLALNAGWDYELLKLELGELQSDGYDLGTLGFSNIELNALTGMQLVPPVDIGETDREGEWDGMPEFDQEDATSFKQIIIHFANEDDMADFAQLIGQKITMKTKSLWHPAQVRMDTDSRRYVEEEQ